MKGNYSCPLNIYNKYGRLHIILLPFEKRHKLENFGFFNIIKKILERKEGEKKLPISKAEEKYRRVVHFVEEKFLNNVKFERTPSGLSG